MGYLTILKDKVLSQPKNREAAENRLQQRRLRLLHVLERQAMQTVQAQLLPNLQQSRRAAFVISDRAARAIRQGLSDSRRRENESSAIAWVSVAAQTPDKRGIVYRVDSFIFENIGTPDYVVARERETLGRGEIEVHTHVYTRPEYLDAIDLDDLITAVAGPSWVHPRAVEPYDTHIRVFGILSVYPTGFARLQFYDHNLKANLAAQNNYGLQRLGAPITLSESF